MLALLWATSTLSVVTWQSPPPGTTAARTRFVNVAAAAGVTFVHRHSPTADKHYPESVPGGVAVFDYNGDGRPDIFFTNGAEMPTLAKRGDAYANRLYRNDGGMKFTDVTAASGVSGAGYAMGAAAADYDNDGHVDLFVTGVARNQLLHNRGDGSFEDVTERSRLGSGEWAAAAGWFDYDNDGRLDLLVINYVRWSAQGGRFCGDQSKGVRIYCHPRYFEGLPNRLYRNRGDGTFDDVSASSGIARHVGKGMSVAFADYDHDGDMDAFVTNDTVPNFLFRNNGDGTFSEAALTAGVAVPESGRPISGMGTDFQDYDNDGWEDIHLTGISGETFPLFRNDSSARPGTFADATASSGIGRMSARLSGWCSVMADVDNDGDKDLFTANSHPNDRIERSEALGWQQSEQPLRQRRQGPVPRCHSRIGARQRRGGPPRLRGRGLRRRRPFRHRGAGSRRSGRVVAQRKRQRERVACDRPDRHAQQSRRHRRQGDGCRTGPHDEHSGRLRVFFARRCALRLGRRVRAGDCARRLAVGREADGREGDGSISVDRDQGTG